MCETKSRGLVEPLISKRKRGKKSILNNNSMAKRVTMYLSLGFFDSNQRILCILETCHSLFSPSLPLDVKEGFCQG